MSARGSASVWRIVTAVLAVLLGGVVAQLALEDMLADTIRDETAGEAADVIYSDLRGPNRNPIRSLEAELARALALGRLDLPTLRDQLIQHRLDLNLYLGSRVFARRAVWLVRMEQGLKLAGALLVLILLGPVVILRRSPPSPSRAATVARAIPYFVVTTAVVIAMFDFMVGSLAAIQRIQTAIGVAGHPAVATSDATIHYLIVAEDKELERLAGLLFEARERMATDPVGALGLVDHLWYGFQTVRRSALLTDAWSITRSSAFLLEGYIVLLVAATFLLVITLVVPVIRRLVSYPVGVVEGRADPRLRRFLLGELRQFWREIRTFVWMLLFVLFFMALVLIAVRAIAFPVAVIGIKTALALELLLRRGGTLPDLGLLLNLVSLSLFVALATMICAVPAGLVLSKAHVVVRERVHRRRRFRDSPAFWSMIRELHWRVVMPTIGAVIAVLGVYFVALHLSDSPGLRIWLPAVQLAPGLGLLIWRFRVVPRLWRLARTDPLAALTSGAAQVAP